MVLRASLAVALLLLPATLSAVDPLELPAVARPRFQLGERTLGSGTAFFLPSPDEVGVAAVTTAHAFELSELVRAEEVVFQTGRSGQPVGYASRLLAPPGRPFSDPGGTLRDDYLVFALDAPPRGVRVLRPDTSGAPLEGARVRLLGVPAAIPQDEDDLFGTVRRVTDTRLELDLDVAADLRGWGGAPVLRHPEGTVVGIVEAAWPEAGTLRIAAAPIAGVVAALAQPLAGGAGKPFAALAGVAPAPVAVPDAPHPATAREAALPGETATARDTAPPGAPTGPRETAPAGGATRARAEPSRAPETIGSETAVSARRAATPRPEGEPLTGPAEAPRVDLQIQIETPEDGTLVDDAATGAFVAGRALALLGEFKRFDVMLVLDTSASTAEMTGSDVNGNGVIGQGGLKSLFGDADPGDSILAAEVTAARRLLQGLDPRTTRVGVVSFAGTPPRPPGVITIGGRSGPAAIVEEPLTHDYARIEQALRHVLERGPDGMTNMSEAVDTAWVELGLSKRSLSEVDPDSQKVILFLTDGQPTGPYDPVFEADNIKAVLRAASRAERMGITIHSFALGPEALDGPVATVEMAERTHGTFTPVREPGDIVDVIESISLANVQSVEVRNLSTGEDATQVQTSPDGSFAALVPLQNGRNRIQVSAHTADGVEGQREITVDAAPGAPPPTLPRDLLAKRTRLLERRLVEIRRERLAVEREQVEHTRKELEIQIEQEREAARARAERQRKELDIGPEDGDLEGEPPAAPQTGASAP